MLRLIERNVRVPDKVLGDIRSLISACLLGERGFLQLVDRYDAAFSTAPIPAPSSPGGHLAPEAIFVDTSTTA